MKSNVKYIIIAVVALLFVGGAILFFKVLNNKDKSPFRVQEVDGLRISNVTIKYENGISSYKGTVTATKDVNVKIVKIVVTKDGKDHELVGYIGKELKNGEEVTINASLDKDITNPSDIKYSLQLNN